MHLMCMDAEDGGQYLLDDRGCRRRVALLIHRIEIDQLPIEVH